MLQHISIVIQLQKSYDTLEVKIGEKFSGSLKLYEYLKGCYCCFLCRNLKEFSKIGPMKSTAFLVRKILQNLLHAERLNVKQLLISSESKKVSSAALQLLRLLVSETVITYQNVNIFKIKNI